MKLTETQQELIQKYLSNTLSEKDQVLFDAEKTNLTFKKELLAQAELLNSIELSKDIDLRNKLESLDAASTTEDSKVVSINQGRQAKRFSLLKYAAMFAVLLAAVFVLKENLNTNQDFDSNQLYAEYYQVMPAEFNQRSNGESLNEVFGYAMENYKSKNYTSALDLLKKLDANSTKVQLYKAICYTELDNGSQALSLLKSVSENGKLEEKQNAEWYLSLLYLKQSKLSLAKETLKKITKQGDHLFLSKAKKLLKELN